MKKGFKVGIWMLLALVFVAQAMSAPPFESSSVANDALEIVYPKITTFQKDADFDLYFHVYNSTSHLLENHTATCDIHIYNVTSNEHIIVQNLARANNGKEFEIEVPANVSSVIGWHQYIVTCKGNTSAGQNQSGFLSSSFEISEDGFPKQDAPSSFLWVVILLPFLLGVIFVVGSATMSEEHGVLKIFMFLLSAPMFFISLLIGMKTVVRFYNMPEVLNGLGDSIYVIAIIFGLILVYFIIYLVIVILDWIATNKRERLEY